MVGRVKLGRRTKSLAGKLRPGDIAIVDHTDMDELAARALVRQGTACVVNVSPALSGRYPAKGPGVLLSAKVMVVDSAGRDLFRKVKDGDMLEVSGGTVFCGGEVLACGRLLTEGQHSLELSQAERGLGAALDSFLANTMAYSRREWRDLLGPLKPPLLRTRLRGRPAVVVARGPGYAEDLRALREFIGLRRPALIAVDGGADALLSHSWQADLVVGDMDSVSDRALRSARERVVHAYPNGRAPGAARLTGLGLGFSAFAVRGTSEDAALLLAHCLGADPIITVGTHNFLNDFLDKGRKGMASTLLVRLRLGEAVIDARGLSRLQVHDGALGPVAASALLPAGALLASSPALRYLVQLLWLRLKLALAMS
ncbi:MAG: putative cytokinetic ring protein SteA [Bacillota bacterium]